MMESQYEGHRLLAQERANPSRERLLNTGLAPGMRAVDIGCGAGAVTVELANVVGQTGLVVAVEPSESRLALARGHVGQCEGGPKVQFVQASLPDTGLEGGSFDYVLCQFVLEYLRDPLPAIHELKRLARQGGKVVVPEIDGFGLACWPMPQAVEAGRERFLAALSATGFDLFIGRKLFNLFRKAGLRDVRVHLSTFHVSGGADLVLVEDWRTRFAALAPVAEPSFGSKAAYQAFADAYLAALADPDTLKYSVVLTTEGTR